MSTVRRVVRNTTVLLAAQIASALIAFFYMMYAARYLGPASFGILSFALAFTGIFAVLADLGLASLTTREVARDKALAPKYLANVSLIKLILAAITFGIIAVSINLMGYPAETITVVYLLALFVILQTFIQMFYSLFQAYERMEFQGVGQMLNAALMLGGVILAIKYSFGVVGFASLYVIANIVTLAYSFAVMKLKFAHPASASATETVGFDRSFWKPTIKEALPFGLSTMFVAIYYWISSVMLSAMQGNEAVGWYNAAYRMVLVLTFIPTALLGSLFPVMSRLHISSYESLKAVYERAFKYLLIIGLPISVGTTILADRIILLIYGLEYAPAIIVLQILVWSDVFIFLNTVFGTLLNSVNKQITVTKQCALAAVLNVVLNLLLIPRYSYIGAGVATVATECFAFVFLFTRVSKIGYGLANRATLILAVKIITAALLMGTFATCCAKLNLGILIASSALVYFALIYLFRVADKTDIDLIKHLIRRAGRSEDR